MVKRKRVDAWADRVSEAPRSGLPDERGVARARWQRRYVTFATYALVPSLLLAVFAVFGPNTSDGQVQAAPGTVTADDPLTVQSRAVATQAVRDWLAGDPSPLPGGRVLSWNYAREVPAMSAPGQETDPDGHSGGLSGGPTGAGGQLDRILAHRFTLTDGTNTFSSQVTTIVDPSLGVQTVGTPSLVPYAPSAPQLQAGTPWPGAVTVGASSSVEEAVRQWAKAFTGQDPAALRLATGDPDSAHSYMPLMGVSLARVELGDSSVPASLLNEEGRAPADPDVLITRVELMFTWGEEPAQGNPASDAQPVSYDLLIHRADTASPQVVAWGGPGSGPELKPFQNAVTGRTLVAPTDSDNSSSQPTDEQSSSDQGDGSESSGDAGKDEQEEDQ
ncbi:hypothetical protein GCG21_13610 [Pseudactinotalea sp. HY160]|uniref:hypothetical protein n=1 Tax=Pseudactinotalea sp. HY160 TaxID=2654490 RepID=UPI00128C4FB9|nr:hypothetical protein [Pseudactinotalea sp. HY160]MPV51023.1 hypothetical protein [Pseudactinotalea sp. HY160]